MINILKVVKDVTEKHYRIEDCGVYSNELVGYNVVIDSNNLDELFESMDVKQDLIKREIMSNLAKGKFNFTILKNLEKQMPENDYRTDCVTSYLVYNYGGVDNMLLHFGLLEEEEEPLSYDDIEDYDMEEEILEEFDTEEPNEEYEDDTEEPYDILESNNLEIMEGSLKNKYNKLEQDDLEPFVIEEDILPSTDTTNEKIPTVNNENNPLIDKEYLKATVSILLDCLNIKTDVDSIMKRIEDERQINLNPYITQDTIDELFPVLLAKGVITKEDDEGYRKLFEEGHIDLVTRRIDSWLDILETKIGSL